jgi:hypothetical protein
MSWLLMLVGVLSSIRYASHIMCEMVARHGLGIPRHEH